MRYIVMVRPGNCGSYRDCDCLWPETEVIDFTAVADVEASSFARAVVALANRSSIVMAKIASVLARDPPVFLIFVFLSILLSFD